MELAQTQNSEYGYQFTEADKSILQTITNLENQVNEKELEIGRLRADISTWRKKLNLSWPEQITYCLKVGTGHFILKAPIEVSNCIASIFKFTADRELKNNVATYLSMMHNNGEIGKVIIKDKGYYGLMEYFENKTALKEEYKYLIDRKKELA